jgi:hypothetical protein
MEDERLRLRASDGEHKPQCDALGVVVLEDKQVTKVQDRATCALKEAVSTMAK